MSLGARANSSVSLQGAQTRRALGSDRWMLRLFGAGALVFAGYLGLTARAIVRQAHCDESRHAGAIVVFGAAEYSGRPSPVLRARLDHAYDLYEHGIAPLVIVTGGAGADPMYSEGGVGRDYLIKRGVPDEDLIAETQSGDTAESAQRTAHILYANGLRECVAVSDAYHIYRIKRMLGAEGITVYGAPRPGSVPQGWLRRALAAMREAFSYMLWRLHVR
jgi:uncharacterized SAM-binding protein YcdF (DUF218 family)